MAKRLLATQDEARRITVRRSGERITLLRKIVDRAWASCGWARDDDGWPVVESLDEPSTWPRVRCPYPVGTEMWVAETFVIETSFNLGDYPPPFSDGRPVRYYKDFDFGKWWDQPHYRATDPEPDLAYEGLDGPACRWTPSCRMPQWASRSRLVVRDVGVDGAQWKYTMEKV